FIARPRSAARFLRARLRPVPVLDSKRVDRLLADLDSRRYLTRRQADRELEELGDLVKARLQRALRAPLSIGVRRQIERILQRLESFSGERLRTYRALVILERIGNAEAQAVLAHLAQGAPGAWLTQEAKASLDRLRQRPVPVSK